MDDVLSEKLTAMDEFFAVKSEEVFGYLKSKHKFENSLQKRNEEMTGLLTKLNKSIDSLDINDMSIDNFEKASQQIENTLPKLQKQVDKIWTENDKKIFSDIFKMYSEITIKNKVSIKIVTLLTKNELVKLFIQALIFLFTYVGTYFASPILESFYSSLGDFWSDFFTALILFLSLERLAGIIEERLLIWRVKNMWLSFIKLEPVFERAQKLINIEQVK